MSVTFWKRLRAGFSLIEVNMAIFVLAGGALALMGLFPLGMRDSLTARNEMRVATFAERFVSATRIAAEVATDENDFKKVLSDFVGNIKIGEPGDSDYSNPDHDSDNDVYYCTWMIDEGSVGENKKLMQVGVKVAPDKYTLKAAQIYVARVLINE